MTPDPQRRFDESYFRETYGVVALRRFSMPWWSAQFYARLAARCMRRIAGRRLLEAGCGCGFTLSFLERRFETWGFDVSPYAVAQCARNAPRSRCIVADLERDLPDDLPRASFDLVLARYVLEHLTDPGAALRRIAGLLRPGGALLFAVPNTASLGARWKGDEWYARKDPTHASLLPPDEWLRLTRAAGLSVERETADGYWDLPYVRWLPGWVQFPLFIVPSALTCLAGRALLPPRFGENVIVVARRD